MHRLKVARNTAHLVGACFFHYKNFNGHRSVADRIYRSLHFKKKKKKDTPMVGGGRRVLDPTGNVFQ
jgi:hypothetical protein